MFAEFLKNKLKSFKIDVGVYHGYFLGILEDNGDEEEKREMLTDIISSLIESDVDTLVNEIFNKWNESHGSRPNGVAHTAAAKPLEPEKVDLAKMLETSARIAQQSSTHHNRQLTDEEKRIKQQILANYSQCSDKEEDDSNEESESDEDPNLEKNNNKLDVQKLAKEKREQAKLESQQKKLKDKEDRAKQKATRDEKKEKRKAASVKGERRR